MNVLLKDIRYAARALRKNAGFTLVAVLTLAIGIGANTAVFSMVRALMLRPLDYANLDRLVWVWTKAPKLGIERESFSPADFLDLRARTRTFAALAAWNQRSASLTGVEFPEQIQSAEVTPGLFSMLPARPLLGRDFRSEEGEAGQDGVVILSHGLWARRFASDPAIVGRTVRLSGRERVVVGVMPPRFDFVRGSELWTPLAMSPERRAVRDVRSLNVIGLLGPGVSRQRAAAELATVAGSLARQFPATNADRSAWPESFRDAVVGGVAPAFYVLLSLAAFLVLLIACANVANLLLARASVRRREIAIRVAVGASRGRVVRQLLTESLLLALLGALVGMLVAVWGVDFMVKSIPASITWFIPGWQGFGIDGTVLAYAVAVAIATGIVFGLAPAFQISRTNANESLKEGQKAGAGLTGMRARKALVIAEVAVALVMVTGATLVVKGFQKQMKASPGFDSGGLLTMSVSLPSTTDSVRIAAYWRQSLLEMRALPGVTSAALTNRLPWTDWGGNRSARRVDIEGVSARRPEDRPKTEIRTASPDYFETLRIPLLAGRDFSERDHEDAERVVIVSRALARQIGGNTDAVGRLIRIEHPHFGHTWRRVIGVAGDVTMTWWNPVAEGVCYLPSSQVPLIGMDFAIRTDRDPMSLAGEARTALARVSADQPAYEVATLDQRMNELYSPLRMTSSLMSVFGILALLLATIGVYGLISYSVSQRTHEIGVRMALGAQRTSVLGLVLKQGMGLAGVGLAIGLPISYAMSRFAASQLFGLVSVEAWALVAITATLLAVALAACALPARVALRVEPMRALRSE
jgi:putative ABC transport system permease protein